MYWYRPLLLHCRELACSVLFVSKLWGIISNFWFTHFNFFCYLICFFNTFSEKEDWIFAYIMMIKPNTLLLIPCLIFRAFFSVCYFLCWDILKSNDSNTLTFILTMFLNILLRMFWKDSFWIYFGITFISLLEGRIHMTYKTWHHCFLFNSSSKTSLIFKV